jgi:lysophospholipase L1-like esterase
VSRRRKILLWLLGLLVLGELAVRAVDALEGGTGSLYDYVVPVGHRHKLRPDSKLIVPERYGDVDYRFNHQGYRDDEPSTRPGVRRIVLLGDSVAFGLGVDQDRIFANLLERRLGPPWEIANLAIFAYHSGNELEALETDGVKLRPELVVVQFYMNDFSIPQSAGGPEPPPGLGARLTAVKNRLLYSSALYRRLHQAAAGLAYLAAHDARRKWFPETLNKAEPVDKLALLQSTPDDEKVAAFRVLRRIRDVANAHGARTLIVLMPDEVQLFTPEYDGINRRFAAFCARSGIGLFDPLPALRASPERADFYLDGVHLTERGHQEIAGLLFDELRRRGLTATRPPR